MSAVSFPLPKCCMRVKGVVLPAGPSTGLKAFENGEAVNRRFERCQVVNGYPLSVAFIAQEKSVVITFFNSGACHVQVTEGKVERGAGVFGESKYGVRHGLSFAFVDCHDEGELEGEMWSDVNFGGFNICSALHGSILRQFAFAGSDGNDKNRLVVGGIFLFAGNREAFGHESGLLNALYRFAVSVGGLVIRRLLWRRRRIGGVVVIVEREPKVIEILELLIGKIFDINLGIDCKWLLWQSNDISWGGGFNPMAEITLLFRRVEGQAVAQEGLSVDKSKLLADSTSKEGAGTFYPVLVEAGIAVGFMFEVFWWSLFPVFGVCFPPDDRFSHCFGVA